ncbi:MAG: DUF4136 domain-containing protein [Sphingobacteriia bacterium]|nr:MAG: DUF4136 domain-containing protein [Sphingobacteriia bacterium]
MRKMLFIAALALLGACAGPAVMNTKTAPGADFSQYKTFSFYDLTASGDTVSAGFNDRIGVLKSAIGDQLKARGFQPAAQGDLRVNIGLVVKEEVQTRQTDWRTDGRYKYVGQRNYTWQSEEIEVGRYRTGTVTLHLVDAAKNSMVWKGSVNGVLPEKEKNLPKVANEAMAELFKQFPVAQR